MSEFARGAVREVAEADGELGPDGRGWSILLGGGEPWRTPAGALIAHPSAALIDLLATEASSTGGPTLESLSAFSLFCTMRDFVEKESLEEKSCRALALSDPTLRTCPGPEAVDQIALLGAVQRFCDAHGVTRLMLSQAGDADDQAKSLELAGVGSERDAYLDVIERRFWSLSSAQRSIVTNCVQIHGVFLLGVLLAGGECTPEEYAEGTLAAHCVIPGVFDGVTQEDWATARGELLEDANIMARFRDASRG